MEAIWKDVLGKTKGFTAKPERFLEPSESEFDKSKTLVKVLYDATKSVEGQIDRNTLPELIIDNFDEEQVWAAIELQNKSHGDYFPNKISQLLSLKPDQLDLFAVPNQEQEEPSENEEAESEDDLPPLDLNKDTLEEEEEEDSDGGLIDDNEQEKDSDQESGEDEADEMDSILNDPDFQNMSDSDLDDKLPLFDKEESSDDDSIDEDENAEKFEKEREKEEARQREVDAKADDYLTNVMKTLKSRSGKKQNELDSASKNLKSSVEDDFFKLDDMEKFLDAEDAKFERGDDEDNNDGGIDLFDDQSDTEDENAKYKDYFGGQAAASAGSDQDESESEDETEPPAKKSKGSKDLLSDNSSDETSSSKEDLGEIKSTHEQRSARLQKRIREMEDEAVEEKKWQMTGEVAAAARPENALLEEHLDYETVSKQAPIITEEVSKRLQDIIIQRIKDQAWDDVERKVKPVENPYDYKKKLILDQEKSKLSLAQVYEEEYLKQKGDAEAAKKTVGLLDDDQAEDDPKAVQEIKRRMNELFVKLDTLTHYHYTPKPVNADVKIVRNLPTLAMEEVAPTAMSDAQLLAPQEIVDKKRGEEIGTDEREKTDKNRDRRLKKAKQRKTEKAKIQKEKLVAKLNPGLGNKHSKKAVMKEIEKAEKEGKVKTIKDKSKAVKSSTAFFNQLQNEALSVVQDGRKTSKKKKAKGHLNPAALKL